MLAKRNQLVDETICL